MGQVISVCSGKGGVGKSSVSTILSLSLVGLGRKVLLIDADLGLNNLDLLLGIKIDNFYDIYDVLKGRISLDEAIVKVNDSLDLVTLYSASSIESFDKELVSNIIASLSLDYEHVIIDSPAGIEKGFELAINASQMSLIILNATPSSFRDALKVEGLIKKIKDQKLKFILNRQKKASLLLDILPSIKSRLSFAIFEDKDVIKTFQRNKKLQERLTNLVLEDEKVK